MGTPASGVVWEHTGAGPARRGGDGGTAPNHPVDARANRRIEMTCGAQGRPVPTARPDVASRVRANSAAAAVTVATRDASDRAHGRVDPASLLLVPAADRDGRPTPGLQATPRRYHPSQVTSAGVGVDSAFESTWLRQRWLAQAGLPVPRVVAESRGLSVSRGPAQRVRVQTTRAERAAESLARRFLRGR